MNTQDEQNDQLSERSDNGGEDEEFNFEPEEDELNIRHPHSPVDQGAGQDQEGDEDPQDTTSSRDDRVAQELPILHEQGDPGRARSSVSTQGLGEVHQDGKGDAETRRSATGPRNSCDDLEHTPSSDSLPTIHLDETSPQAVPSRRSEDPMAEFTRDARRFSTDHFQSPGATIPSPMARRAVPPPGESRWTRPTAPGLSFQGTVPEPSTDERRFTMPTGVDYTPIRSNPQFAQQSRGGAQGMGDPDPDPSDPGSDSHHSSRHTTPAPSPVPPPRVRRTKAQEATRPTSPPCAAAQPQPQPRILRGTGMTLRTTPLDFTSQPMNKIWDKHTRHLLSAEDRLAFEGKAGGYVLGKNNKLRLLTQTAEDDEILTKNYNLQYQVLALKQHCHEHDTGDVMGIVKQDSRGFPMLTEYNLFDDYMKIDPVVVAQSNVLYNRYVSDPYVGQNMALIFNMLKMNTQETLFYQCLELYLKYHPMQQGGPLMWSLIMQKISSRTEQQLDYLKLKVKQLRISSLEGENVDKAVSLLDAALSTFKAASTPTVNRIPQEWNKDLLDLFQTSSVSNFNNIFLKIQQDVRQVADMEGLMPEWPDHEEVIRLARATYNRLKLSGEWDVPAASQKKAMVAEIRRPFRPDNNKPQFEPTCWNCGNKGHKLQQCTQALDQPKIDKMRIEWKNKRGRFNSNSNSNSRYQNQNNKRANIAVKTKSKNKNRDKPERAAAPQVNMAAQQVNAHGYTNRNLEDIVMNVL